MGNYLEKFCCAPVNANFNDIQNHDEYKKCSFFHSQ